MSELEEYWHRIEALGDLELTLPDSTERLELDDGQLLVANEFGDGFGVLDGSDDALAHALARALDQLYGVEWGTAGAPEIDPTSRRAVFDAFGTRYVAVWHRHPSKLLLLAIATPEREARARAFVAGVSIRG